MANGGRAPDFPRGARATRNIADASLGLHPTVRPATIGKFSEFSIAVGVAVISSNHPVGASWVSLLGGGREDLESDEKGGDELHCYKRREEVYFCRDVETSERNNELNEMNGKSTSSTDEMKHNSTTTYFWFGLVFFYEQSGGVCCIVSKETCLFLETRVNFYPN